jgi:hypothetical protein
MIAAHCTVGAASELELTESQSQRVIRHQASDQQIASTDDQLQCFGRLNHAHHTRQHAKHTSLRAVRH